MNEQQIELTGAERVRIFELARHCEHALYMAGVARRVGSAWCAGMYEDIARDNSAEAFRIAQEAR